MDLLHTHQQGKVIMPKLNRPPMTQNEITLNTHKYIPTTLLLAICKYINFLKHPDFAPLFVTDRLVK